MSRGVKFGLIVLVALISLALRIFAANRLPINADESIYVNSALEYANYIREGEWKWLAWNTTNYEHPSLNKILYGFLMLGHDPIEKLYDKDVGTFIPIGSTDARPWIITGRYFSVFFGTLAVLLLALIHPLAGLMLGIDTLNIQYTSVMYLEALPLFASFLAVLGYQFFIRSYSPQSGKSDFRWLALSAACLGVTAASKYIYSIAGIAILAHFAFWSIKNKPRPQVIFSLIIWGVLSIAFFFAFNPYLWPHPVERLIDSLSFHLTFSNSINVSQFGYPWWQPFKWFTAMVPGTFASTPAAFLIQFDLGITILALIGLPRLWLRRPLFFIWLLVGLATLLLWPTKWPQYPMIVMVPYSLSAAEGILFLGELIQRMLTRVHVLRGKFTR
jgi:hypothetical protein